METSALSMTTPRPFAKNIRSSIGVYGSLGRPTPSRRSNADSSPLFNKPYSAPLKDSYTPFPNSQKYAQSRLASLNGLRPQNEHLPNHHSQNHDRSAD
jgi:hypothetical protein